MTNDNPSAFGVTEGPAGLDDPRVVEALEQYLAALEAGRRPDRPAFLSRHAAIADALTECLDGMEALHGASHPAPGGNGGAGAPAAGRPGDFLGDYRILREVGRGGMGVVYEAEQISLGRRLALKVLPFALTLDPRQLQRFKNEARAAAHLDHPHIVPVYAEGCENGVHFYAMPFIEGRSLAEVIRDLQLGRPPAPLVPTSGTAWAEQKPSREGTVVPRAGDSWDDGDLTVQPVGVLSAAYATAAPQYYPMVARLGVQAAEALEHAHQCGVIHRDVKPGNLLLDQQGELWVTDFGLAQSHAAAGLTETGDLLGTLRYMSPEQARGQRVPLDPRTDVYSLGATLYELLTLRPPFEGADRETLLRQILNDEPRPPRAVEPSVPVELETIVLKALGKTPAERYGSAQELADDLNRFLRQAPIRARRATLRQRARKWARRHPWVAVASLALCVLTACGSLAVTALVQEQKREADARKREAEERFQLAQESVDEMVRLSEEELVGKHFLNGPQRRLLQAAGKYYQRLLEQEDVPPSAREALEEMRQKAQRLLAEQVELHDSRPLYLLADSDVLEDLAAPPGQRDRINGLAERMAAKKTELFRDAVHILPEERHRRALANARANAAEAADILKPGQHRRLQQIALQVEGPSAFQDPDVEDALRLTPEQKKKIRALEPEMTPGGPGRSKHGPHGHGGPGKSPPPLPVDRILAVLEPAQAQAWKELTGEPFKGRMAHAPPPRHYGPPHGEPDEP